MELKRLLSIAKAIAKQLPKSRNTDKIAIKVAARQLYKERKKEGIDMSRLRRSYNRDNKTMY